MIHSLSISEARKKLPALLRAIEKDPGVSFLIQVRKEPIATLSSAKKILKAGKAVRSLLNLIKNLEPPPEPSPEPSKEGADSVTSENYKDFLYGPSRS